MIQTKKNVSELTQGDFEKTLDAALMIRFHKDGTITYIPDSFRGKVSIAKGVDMVYYKTAAVTDKSPGMTGIGLTGFIDAGDVDALLRAVTPRANFWKPWRAAAQAASKVIESMKVGTDGATIIVIDVVNNGMQTVFDDDMKTIVTCITQDPRDSSMDILEVR